MKLYAHYDWFGSPYALFPDEFAKVHTGEFVYRGEKPKGFVVYAGSNESRTPD